MAFYWRYLLGRRIFYCCTCFALMSCAVSTVDEGLSPEISVELTVGKSNVFEMNSFGNEPMFASLQISSSQDIEVLLVDLKLSAKDSSIVLYQRQHSISNIRYGQPRIVDLPLDLAETKFIGTIQLIAVVSTTSHSVLAKAERELQLIATRPQIAFDVGLDEPSTGLIMDDVLNLLQVDISRETVGTEASYTLLLLMKNEETGMKYFEKEFAVQFSKQESNKMLEHKWIPPDVVETETITLYAMLQNESDEFDQIQKNYTVIDRDFHSYTQAVKGGRNALLKYLKKGQEGGFRSRALSSLEELLTALSAQACDASIYSDYKEFFTLDNSKNWQKIQEKIVQYDAFEQALKNDKLSYYQEFLNENPSSPCSTKITPRVSYEYWEAKGDDPHALLQLANFFRMLDDIPTADSYYKRATENDYLPALIAYGIFLYNHSLHPESEKYLFKSIENSEVDYQAYYFLGMIFSKKGDRMNNKALGFIAKAISLNKSCADCYKLRASIYKLQLNNSMVKKDCKKIIELHEIGIEVSDRTLKYARKML